MGTPFFLFLHRLLPLDLLHFSVPTLCPNGTKLDEMHGNLGLGVSIEFYADFRVAVSLVYLEVSPPTSQRQMAQVASSDKKKKQLGPWRRKKGGPRRGPI